MYLSADVIGVPETVHASVSGAAAIDLLQPRVTRERAELDRDTLGDRLDRAYRVAVEENGTVAQQPAPRFADFDPRRLSLQPAAEGQPTAIDDYAWISGETAAVTLASLDQRFAAPAISAAREAISPAVADAEIAEDDEEFGVPVPMQRPRIAAAPATEEPARAAVATAAPEPRQAKSGNAGKSRSSAALAYANPNAGIEEDKSGGIFGRLFGKRNNSLLPGRGSKVAVYDIGAATVYMPNGEKLEAHSGLAHMKDNPRFVAEKNKGPTPPNLYRLKMREARFHGVEAIRLLPADGKKKFNRDGLLAHTYMYVRNGGKDKSQSNGCVVFADYDKFLNAFKRGQIEHLIVVPHLKEVPTYMAAL